MLATFLLSLREGLEAALIIGIVLGAINKIHRKDLAPSVWLGTLSAVIVSIVTAVILTSFGMSLEEQAEQIFEGITMLVAAGILTWMIFWMGKQARFLKSELEDGVNKAAATTGKRAVFTLAFMAVVREGIELAIFITAAFFAGNQVEASANLIQTLAGTILGLGTAVLLGYTIFATTVRLDLRRFFQVTGILLILFAAGLVAHGVHEFNEVGWIPAVVEHVWDVNMILDENSIAGQLLKTLFGYNGNPSLTEIISYFTYIVVVAFFWRRENAIPAKAPATAEAKA
ncbi:MAG: iron transporter [Anaerolineales bacterium]|nr:iron transporter [Anaerolineae bacterium]PWB68830.1 MAG: iron transporter [Anaerolineales bacterium]